MTLTKPLWSRSQKSWTLLTSSMAETRPIRAIDSSVLLRYLLNDDLDRAERARRLIESSERLGVTPVALAEAAWTLTGPRHRLERSAVAGALLDLLARENIITVGMDKAEAQAALLACAAREGAAHFGDALIAACARSAGISEIYTFDARFERAGIQSVALH
jgi:predicted nucleic acid-binding protein